MEGEILQNETSGRYIIYNNSMLEVQDFNFSLTKKYPGIYEVIRIIDGIPIFLENHISRFNSSSKLLGFEQEISRVQISEAIKRLISCNNSTNGNIKIVINGFEGQNYDIYGFFIPHKYPSAEEIKNGVHTILFHAERNNPNAKSTDLEIREKINGEMADNNAYEALLVNKNGEITEGSRSNVFFVKNEDIYTPPLKDVLPGITRGYVIDICSTLGYSITENTLGTGMLVDIDGLFMTGTSPQVLPISSVGEKQYASASNPVIAGIRQYYEKLVEDYVKKHTDTI